MFHQLGKNFCKNILEIRNFMAILCYFPTVIFFQVILSVSLTFLNVIDVRLFAFAQIKDVDEKFVNNSHIKRK